VLRTGGLNRERAFNPQLPMQVEEYDFCLITTRIYITFCCLAKLETAPRRVCRASSTMHQCLTKTRPRGEHGEWEGTLDVGLIHKCTPSLLTVWYGSE
jgi:hypothetical protein